MTRLPRKHRERRPEGRPTSDPAHTSPGRPWLKVLLLLVSLALVAMWVYAFVFAPRGGVNPVRDTAWTDGARGACVEASGELQTLVFRTRITESNKDIELPKFVANLERADATLGTMLDRIEALPRSSEKSKVLVPQWLADYRLFHGDLQAWISELRAGKIVKFGVSITNTGIPVNERINTFATENRIKPCSTDLISTSAGTESATATEPSSESTPKP